MTGGGLDLPAVAVVGLAGRFPAARDVEELWRNLIGGVESIRRLTLEEMRAAAGVKASDISKITDPLWVAAAGVLDGADLFDAAFFQITPREAELLDPQHRVFLETAWEALEDAGCDPSRFAGAIGVFAGAGLNTYLLNNLLPGGESIANPQVAIASDKDFLTTRLSYKLDLKGPSLDVQTGCSSSLVAVVLACQSLLNYQCDLALAGGVAIREPQRAGYLFQENGILSPDGHCRPFDAEAAGTVPGHGAGVVVLKRLDEALAGGDCIRAVILGAALNNDGAAKVGFTAPGVAGQAEVVATALGVAGVRPEDISFIEAHGTATPRGDPIEVTALRRVFGTAEKNSCALGSIKSNLGHLDAAAGVAGLIKTVLALEHRQIPPTLHFRQPHPDTGLEDSPFYVNAEPRAWETAALPRRAGVSSFGIGGTNAHVVVQEAPEPPPRPEPGPETGDRPELLVLSARTAAALDAATERLHRHLESHPGISLRDAAHTLRLGRKQMEFRRAMVVRDRGTLADPERWLTAQRPVGDVRVAFLLPGQGAQHAGMAAGLVDAEPAFRKAWDACREVLRGEGIDLDDLIHSAERMNETALTQPLLFAVEYSLAKLWQSWGVRPAALLGHSLGEYVAACLAGVFPLDAALRLVTVRGRLMQSLPPGAMLSVSLAEVDLVPLLEPETEIAAVNAPDRTVAAGPPEAIERLRRRLAERGVEARALRVERAFHTRAVEAIRGAFEEEVRRALAGSAGFQPGRQDGGAPSNWLSNLTGTWVTSEQATDPAYWGEHLRRPVRFADGVRTLRDEVGWVLLEVGPGQTLTSLARRNLIARPVASLPARDDSTPPHEAVLGALGRLWLAGVEIQWKGLQTGGRKVPLPACPFERQRFWIEPRIEPRREIEPAQEPAGLRVRTPLWHQALPPAARRPLAAEQAVWLVFPDLGPATGGAGSQLLQRLQAERVEPVAVVPGLGFSSISASSYAIDPRSASDYDALLDAVLALGKPLRIVHLGGLGSGGGVEELAAALRRRKASGARLHVIATGTVDPTGATPADPTKASLLGACRGLSAAGIPCRLIDVEPLPPGTPLEGRAMRRLIDLILAELGGSDAGEIVAWRDRRRWVEVWDELPAAGAARKTEGTWRILGDATESGRALADLLADRGARVVVEGAVESPWRDLGATLEKISLRAAAPLSRSGRPGGGRAGEGTGEGAAWAEGPLGADRIDTATGALCTAYVAAAFRSRGIEPARGTFLSFADLRSRLSLAAGQERLLQSLLRMLRDDGLVEIRSDGIQFLRDLAEIPAPEELRRASEAGAPELRGLFELLDQCGRQLAAVLAGEVPGLSVLYPGGSSEVLARAIEAAASEGVEDAAPAMVREMVLAAVGGREGQKGPKGLQGHKGQGGQEEPLRILEVGAGQGTLTWELVPALPAGSVEYWFTDVGRSFVLAAEERATAMGQQDLKFRVLDITRDPAAQGFPLGSFDAVLGVNVVHATPRIAETLGHLRSLLAPGGLIGLIETVRRHRWADLVWGITDGWWSFTDAPLRTDSPLLSAEAWRETLAAAGFADAQSWPREEVENALLLAGLPSPGEGAGGAGRGAGGEGPALRVALTRDAAALPTLAAQTDENSTAVLIGEGATAADLLTAVDRALAEGLSQISVSRGTAAAASPEPEAAEPAPPAASPASTALHGRPQIMTSYVAPRSETEQAIAEIWQTALGIDRVGVHDNFLELGGDSLIGLQVVYAVQKRFSLAGRTLNLYEHSTVAAAARFVTDGVMPGGMSGDGGSVPDSGADEDPFAQRSSRGEQRRERRTLYKRTH
jgi:acyl transferase domain-containing protein/acyl carrier protein